MATLADVENAIVGIVGSALFPGTAYAPLSYAASAPAGLTIKAYRGWPDADTLNKDLAAGRAHVSIFPDNITRLMTRFFAEWEPSPTIAVPALNALVAGNTVTFGGTASPGQAVGIALGDAPYLATWTYRPLTGDTPAAVAAAFATMIPRAVAAGAVLTLNDNLDFFDTTFIEDGTANPIIAGPVTQPVTALVVADQTATLEVRRQMQQIRVSVWCPDPHTRDAVANLVDGALAGLLDAEGRPSEFLALPDGTAARVRYGRSYTDDKPSRNAVWRRDLCYAVEYPTILTAVQPAMLFGQMTLNNGPVLTGAPVPGATARPLVGALRFDGTYGASSVTGSVAQQMAAQLSPAAYQARAPFFATVAGGAVSWPAQTQATMDAEIAAAAQAGLGFWAFLSLQPTDPETLALTLYQSSTLRSKLGFCMVGQLTNWNLAGGPPYAAAAARDVALFLQAGYVTVLGGRPLYFLLDGAGTGPQQAAAVTWLRGQAAAQGSANPYVVWLSGANIAQFDNTAAAQAAGADAAGAYASPILNGNPQYYEALVAAAESDWFARRTRTLPMVPTAMAGWDQRPAVDTPEPYYPVPGGVTDLNYYAPGTPPAIAAHVADMLDFIEDNPAAVPSGVGLIYAWNEAVEGGWIMPTWQPGNPAGDYSRVMALQLALTAPPVPA